VAATAGAGVRGRDTEGTLRRSGLGMFSYLRGESSRLYKKV
jgi:hypothetical protein